VTARTGSELLNDAALAKATRSRQRNTLAPGGAPAMGSALRRGKSGTLAAIVVVPGTPAKLGSTPTSGGCQLAGKSVRHAVYLLVSSARRFAMFVLHRWPVLV
jgi:hypothetical protein